VRLSLTAVENLASACLAAHRWPPGAYNIADATPYSRDAAVSAVLGVPVRHVPVRLVRTVAAMTRTLTPYAIDQVTDGLVLDISRARARGWTPSAALTTS